MEDNNNNNNSNNIPDIELPKFGEIEMEWGSADDIPLQMEEDLSIQPTDIEDLAKMVLQMETMVGFQEEKIMKNENTEVTVQTPAIVEDVGVMPGLENGPNTLNFEHALHLAAKYYRRNDVMPFTVWVETVKRLLDMGKRYSKPYIPSAEQYRALLTTARRVLVDACPGSGKTTTLMHKIFLDGQVLDKTSKQLAITYTKAAADNMNTTYGKLCKRYRLDNTVEFGTIHAFAYKIETWLTGSEVLTPNGINKVIITGPVINDDDSFSWDMADDGELAENEEEIWIHNAEILQKAVESLGYTRNYFSYLGQLESWLNVVVERKIETQEELMRLEIFNELDFVQIEELLDILRVSRGIRESYDVMDFMDMLVNFYERIRGYKTLDDVLDPYIKGLLTLTHIYVDEFQDISPMQWAIIQELLRLNPNSSLYCVGDADQAIYSFRGADSRFLVEFEDVVKEEEGVTAEDVDIIFFTLNRRSGKHIIELTSEFVQKNEFRYDKKMHTFEDKESNIRLIPDPTKTGKISRDVVINDLTEMRRIDPTKYDYSEVGIVYREHQQSFYLMVDAVESGFPINIGGTYHPSHFPEVADIFGIWEMLMNSKNPVLLEKYLYKCMQGLNKEKGAFVATKVRQTGRKFTDFIAGTEILKQDVIDLRMIYRDLAGGNIKGALDKTCYKYFSAYLKLFPHRQWKLDVVKYYLSKWQGMPYMDLIKKHREMKDWIGRYHSNIYGVQFKTIHTSKGLEFNDVYILPVGDSVMPKSKILNKMKGKHKDDYVEEERRLLFVALTRAKVNLTMFAEKLTDTFPQEVYEINTRQSFSR